MQYKGTFEFAEYNTPANPNTGGMSSAHGSSETTSRVVRLSAAQIASPTAEILADTSAIYIGPDGSRYYSNGTRLILVTQFVQAVGAWDGTTDDYAVLQAQLTALAETSTIVVCPAKTTIISQQLTVPNRVALVGAGRRATVIKGSAAFPTSTAVIQLGNTTTLAFDSFLRSLNVEAPNVSGSIGVTATKLQEGAGLFNCLVNGWNAKGLYFPSDNNANFQLQSLEVYARPGSVATAGIHINNNGGKVTCADVTIVGSTSGGSMTNGFWCETSGSGVITGLHCEWSTSGLHLDGANVNWAADNINIAGTVTNVVEISQTNRSVVRCITKGGATNAVKDNTTSLNITDSFVTEYSGRNNYRLNQVLIAQVIGSAANSISPDGGTGNYKNCNTLTENTTVQSPTTAVDGQMLTFVFRQDGTGGRTVTWNAIFHGVTLAASGTANQYAQITFIFTKSIWLQISTSGWVA